MKKEEVVAEIILFVCLVLFIIYYFQPAGKPPSERLLDALQEYKTQKVNNVN